MDVVTICSELVKIRSENPPGFTDEVIAYISEICDSLGLKTCVVSRGRRANLLSEKPHGTLLLCGHVDVVPALDAGWDHPPFSGLVTDRVVYGRGSTDMKGGCAAILAALSAVIDRHGECFADVAFVCDEEGNGEFGMEQLVTEGIIPPCDCLIAEPTPQDLPWVGEKGIFRAHISFSGDSGHSSVHPVLGNSAIIQACSFLRFCHSIHEQTWPVDSAITDAIQVSIDTLAENLGCTGDDAKKILSQVTYNPGIISGGERMNIIAQRCELDLDMRIPWGCDPDRIEELVLSAIPDSECTILEKRSPSFSPPGWLSDLVCEGIQAIRNVKNPVYPGVAQAASDARHLRKKGAEVVLYGPGDLSLLHSVNESVPVRMLTETTRVYEYVLEHLPA